MLDQSSTMVISYLEKLEGENLKVYLDHLAASGYDVMFEGDNDYGIAIKIICNKKHGVYYLVSFEELTSYNDGPIRCVLNSIQKMIKQVEEATLIYDRTTR